MVPLALPVGLLHCVVFHLRHRLVSVVYVSHSIFGLQPVAYNNNNNNNNNNKLQLGCHPVAMAILHIYKI